MVLQVRLDGALTFDGGTVSAAADLSFGERGEEALNLIDPRSRCWCEVHMEVRMTSQPVTSEPGVRPMNYRYRVLRVSPQLQAR